MLPLQQGEKEKWSGQSIPIETRIGRYVVGKKIAQGGMAEVYMATAVGEHGFAKELVLKVVLPELADDVEYMRMFITEACLASKLEHPNIVQVFDFGHYNNRYYIAMEHVHGVSLRRLRARCRHLRVNIPPILAAVICADVAKALGYVHSFREDGRHLNLVHRDVSPHNILLSVDGAVKLTDFGIAKAATTDSRPGVIKGKFAYLSPEQSLAQPLDGRSDIFSLGIVQWELLTGTHLFGGQDDTVTLNAIQRAPIASPSDFGAPRELAKATLKALARPLRDRYQAADEMEWALRSYYMANAKRPEDTSVAQFLRSMFPPEDNFQSTIEPSALESDVPKLALVAAGSGQVKALTVPLRPISPSLKLLDELSDDPADWPTIRSDVLERAGRTTISLPRPRVEPAPSSDFCQVSNDAPSPVNDTPQPDPEDPPISDGDSSLVVVVETNPAAQRVPRTSWDILRWWIVRPNLTSIVLILPLVLCAFVVELALVNVLAPVLIQPQLAEGEVSGLTAMLVAWVKVNTTMEGKPLGHILSVSVPLIGLALAGGGLAGRLAWKWMTRTYVRHLRAREDSEASAEPTAPSCSPEFGEPLKLVQGGSETTGR